MSPLRIFLQVRYQMRWSVITRYIHKRSHCINTPASRVILKTLHRSEICSKQKENAKQTQSNRHNARTLDDNLTSSLSSLFIAPQHSDSHFDPFHSHPDYYLSSPLSLARAEALPPASRRPLAHAHCSSSKPAKQPRYQRLRHLVALGIGLLVASGLDHRAKRLRGMVALCFLRRLSGCACVGGGGGRRRLRGL
jgi:hypothetical protein